MSSATATDLRDPKKIGSLILFLAVVIGAGTLIGIATAPGEWYDGLTKPEFNPPNWIFAPVWTLLYIAIAVAGWRVWHKAPDGAAMKLWVAQLVLNWAWSPLFFSLHFVWPALAVILLIAALIIAFIVAARYDDHVASWLFVPYLAWVSFASLLNFSIAVLN